MTMTVGQLIEMLQDYDPAAEIRLATQPNYPLESSVRGVVSNDDMAATHGDADENIVWITEGSQIGYAPRAAFDAS